MAHQSDLIGPDIETFLTAQKNKDLLRLITCGSVDDGKSTLIGRLLYDSKLVFEDQLAALTKDSKSVGTTGGGLDLALLVDGLAAEREQGITIDVGYRFFSTDKRNFIVADTPGHEQYTRNMATGASTADLAVVLVDARKGILTQTKRHSYIVSLLGIRHLVLAVNKMDLVNWDQATFEAIAEDHRTFADTLRFDSVLNLPLSALTGDNVLHRSFEHNWYTGPTLMGYLEAVEVRSAALDGPFRMPVQWVNRANLDFRGYAGTVMGGRVRVGERLIAQPSGRESVVSRIVTADGDLTEAHLGQSVTLCLNDEIDISRGDVLSTAESPATVADQFSAHLLWMDSEPLLPGRPYLLQVGTQTTTAQITKLKHKVNVDTLENQAATRLQLNELANCTIGLDRQVAADPYHHNRATGSFTVVDRYTNKTVGAGVIDFALRRAHNVHWQKLDVDKIARASLKGQRPAVLWFTGLPGAGKSTIANLVEKRLHNLGRHTYVLDGDNIRHGLNKDLGFTDADRVENIRRAAECARLFADAGLIVLVSFISPFRSERALARERCAPGEFVEIYIDTPLHVCEQRDPKGLYKKARAGEIKNFTGIDSAYEPPLAPEIVVHGSGSPAETETERILGYLETAGILKSYI